MNRERENLLIRIRGFAHNIKVAEIRDNPSLADISRKGWREYARLAIKNGITRHEVNRYYHAGLEQGRIDEDDEVNDLPEW